MQQIETANDIKIQRAFILNHLRLSEPNDVVSGVVSTSFISEASNR